MGGYFENLSPSLAKWALLQKMFWVATAPLSSHGHVNVSPKGGCDDFFGLDDDNKVFWYQEFSGSGSETLSHLYEPNNGRICIMFSAFEGPPRILRFWGHGAVLENGTVAFNNFVAAHPSITPIYGTRSIIRVDIRQVGTSCGFGVPFMDFVRHRGTLTAEWAKVEKRVQDGKDSQAVEKFWAKQNSWSMDGLPGMQAGIKMGKQLSVQPMKKLVGRPGEKLAYATRSHAVKVASLSELVFVGILCLILGAFGVEILRSAESGPSYRLSSLMLWCS